MRNRVAPIACWLAILGVILAGLSKLGDARQTSGAPAAGPQKTIEYPEWKRAAPPVWLDAASEDEELDAVRANLGAQVKIRCEKKPLDQALKLVEAQIDTKILFNKMELGVIGIESDTPITVEASGKLKDVLGLMLAAIENGEAGLSYRITTNGLMITSLHDACAEPQLRTFDLTYFLPDASHADDLANLIMQHVEPDNWVQVGGTSVITPFGSQLVVSAGHTTMLGIERLLAKIAKQDRDNLKAPKFKEDKLEAKSVQEPVSVQDEHK